MFKWDDFCEEGDCTSEAEVIIENHYYCKRHASYVLCGSQGWTIFAFARLGRIRDSMTPADVEAVQNFLERANDDPR